MHGYSYAGYASRDGVSGVAARIRALRMPSVQSGHAAGWVGVGGIHEGPGGASEWLQAGIAAFPGAGLRLYVESVSRGDGRRFVDLGRAVVGRWAAGHAACNRYAYRFDGVSVSHASDWSALGDAEAVGAGVRRDRSGFLASS